MSVSSRAVFSVLDKSIIFLTRILLFDCKEKYLSILKHYLA